MATQLTGVTNVNIDGDSYSITVDGVKFELSPAVKETVMGYDGSLFYKETPTPQTADFTILADSSIDPLQFNDLVASNVSFDFATGISIIFTGAVQTANPEYDSKEGTIHLKFESNQATSRGV